MPAHVAAPATVPPLSAGARFHHVSASRPAETAEAAAISLRLDEGMRRRGLLPEATPERADLVIDTAPGLAILLGTTTWSEPVMDRTGRRVVSYRTRTMMTRSTSLRLDLTVTAQGLGTPPQTVTVRATTSLDPARFMPCLVDAALDGLDRPGTRTVILDPATCGR